MPTDLDFGLYFNVAFLSMLGFGVLFGFLKGFKKSLWGFLVTAIFIAFFFLTIDQVVNVLWTLNMPFLGGVLANVSPSLSGVSTLSESLPILLGDFLPTEFASTVTNANFLEFTTSIALFVVKIVYTILYFTVIQILYRLILWILRMIIKPSKKKNDKYKSKNRLLGSVFGLLHGGMSLYVSLIIFGGLMSIAASVASIVPPTEAVPVRQIEYRSEYRQADSSIITMAAIALPDVGSLDDATEMLNGMIEGYNENIIVTYQNTITTTDPYDEEEQIPLNLYLFDSVLSMTYQEEQIAIRSELDVLTNVAANVLNSDFMESGDLGDITGTEIRSVFTDLGKSNIFTTILPLGIEVASEAFEVDLEIPVAELYDIEWDTEIMQLGEIAATAMDIVNAAGIFNGTMDLDTVTLDGDDVQELFNNLGDSELVTLTAYVAIEPILEMAGENVEAFVTVPANLDWSAEFRAIGALASEVLDSGLTIGAVNSADIGTILPILANIDFTVLLDSQIITNAMINILSGETSIDISAYITIPDGIQWLNLVVDGETVYGELYNILLAINALSESASGIDFTDIENLSLDTISRFSEEDINALFESKILIATISTYIREDLTLSDDFPVILPDSVFDEDDYILKLELQNIVGAVFMLVNELACPLDKPECQDLGVDIDAIFTLDGNNIDTLLLSEILAASAGSLIVDLGADVLTVPATALSAILVEEATVNVVSKVEIKAAFLAISVLGITGIDDVALDPSILTNLALEGQPTVLDSAKADKLFGSVILNATLSSYLLDYASGVDSFIVVPYLAQDNATVIRLSDPVDGTEYISETELTDILEAVLILDIQDFEAIDTIDIGSILGNVSSLLDSSILHATVSKQLLDLTDLVVVPLNDSLGDPLKITVGTGAEETIYIAKGELENAFDALSALEIKAIDDIAIDLTILEKLAVEGQPTVLDTTKSARLFSSSIINATLAKYLLDFTEGENPLVEVPYFDEDGATIRTEDVADGTRYIVETELTNILKAVLVLDIQDFADVDDIDFGVILDNVTVLLDSAILHATVSKQLLDLTTIVVVPTNNELGDPVKLVNGPVGDETTFIVKTELIAAFEALKVLEIPGISDVAFSIDIIKNLAEEDDVTALDTVKAGKLFSSAVINATLSKYIMDFSSGDDPFLVVPNNSQDGTVITVTDPIDSVTVITEEELTNVLKAILKLNLISLDSVETLELGTILGNLSTILDSSIMHASISKQLFDLGTDMIVIPTHHENDDELIITQGTVDYVDRIELENTFDALSALGLDNINNISVDITQILGNLGQELNPTVLDTDKANRLFSSTILKATISKYIIDFSEGATPILEVPQKNEADEYIKTVSSMDGTKYITQTELTNVLSAILALDLHDFNNVSSLSLTTIISKKSVILSSTILQATISKQLIDLTGGLVIIPEFEEDNTTEVLVTRGDLGEEKTFIARLELEDLFDALQVLGLGEDDDLNDFTGTIDLALLDVPGTVDTLVQSAILQATISDQILALAGGGGATLVVIPYETPDGLTALRRTIGIAAPVEMIKQTELKNVIDAFVVLGFTDVDNLGDAITISSLADNASVIFESYTIQATVSNQVLSLESPTVIIPYYNDDLVTPTRLRNISGPLLTTTEYIDKDELISLMAALDELIDPTEGIGDFDGSVDLNLFYDLGPRTILLGSSILQATISKQIIDLGVAIEVPTLRDDSTVVKLTAGTLALEQNDYLVEDEIHALFEALEILEMVAIGDFDSATLNFTKFMPSTDAGYDTNQNILLASACIQATVSGQIIDLRTSGSIVVPTHDITDTVVSLTVGPTEYIKVSEIKHLFNALDVLGFSVTSFNGTVGLTALLKTSEPVDYAANQTTVLASAIMHRTLTDQVVKLSTQPIPAIILPDTNISGTDIDTTVSSNYYLLKTEIKALIDAMDILGVGGNLSGFDGSINLTKLSDGPSQDTLLLSAIMHATLSDELTGTTLDIPDTDINRAVLIRVTQSGTEFIENTEMKALLVSLFLLGLNDFNSMGLNILNIYSQDLTILLASATIQATMSGEILPQADTYAIANSGDFIIPNDAREDIFINTVAANWIEKNELIELIGAFDTMGLGGFNVNIDATSFDSYNQTQIHEILESVSMHLTIEKMIQANANINTFIPDVLTPDIVLDTYYSLTDIVAKEEVELFILAVNVLGGDISGDITATALGGLTLTQQQTVLGSYIARAKLTVDLASAMVLNGDPYDASDYEIVGDATPVCIKYASALEALAYL